jgi:hypothetical protein
VTFVYFSIGAWCGWMLAKIYYREYLPALAPPHDNKNCPYLFDGYCTCGEHEEID